MAVNVLLEMERIMAEQNYVELRHVNKKYKDFQASDDINFGIGKGKLVGLLGPSGSGKTTILRMLAGLEHADSGEIIIDGGVVNDVPASERGIGFVFQNYALFRYMTVYDNIAFGLDVKKWKKADIRRRVDELVELVGLKGFEKRYPNQLSGGQRQRVAFARALAPNPELLLLDEPFSALDYQTRLNVSDDIGKILKKAKKPAILVTHDISEAISMADRILILTARPASVRNIVPIHLDIENRTPLSSRNAPDFKSYFNLIWKELNKNE